MSSKPVRFDAIPFFRNKLPAGIVSFVILLWFLGSSMWVAIKGSMIIVVLFFLLDGPLFKRYDGMFQEQKLQDYQLVLYKGWCLLNFLVTAWLLAILICAPIYGVYEMASK